MTLIDALYEHRVKLLAAADAEPAGLYPAGDGSFEFERTVSRLEEMRSADYLAEGMAPPSVRLPVSEEFMRHRFRCASLSPPLGAPNPVPSRRSRSGLAGTARCSRQRSRSRPSPNGARCRDGQAIAGELKAGGWPRHQDHALRRPPGDKTVALVARWRAAPTKKPILILAHGRGRGQARGLEATRSSSSRRRLFLRPRHHDKQGSRHPALSS